MLQHIATYRNRVTKRMQHVVPNNVARCCVEMLRAFGQAFITHFNLTFRMIQHTSSEVAVEQIFENYICVKL